MDSFKQPYDLSTTTEDTSTISSSAPASEYVPTYHDHPHSMPVQAGGQTASSATLIKEILETLLFTFFVIWFVKTASQNFRIEGASMQPTLQEGEYLIVNRLSYFLDEPERGDIIVLHFPNDRSRDFIKRIIGLPGDTIAISNGEVRVNDILIEEPYIKDTSPNNQTWLVTEDHYFVMGDNRRNSSDSRSWSFLPEDDIIGQAWVVYWPPKDWQFVPHFEHAGIPEPAG
ncbi:MAG: signal peptidase I [Cellvibrionaceae bacterium]|jgi:signal peptidase I